MGIGRRHRVAGRQSPHDRVPARREYTPDPDRVGLARLHARRARSRLFGAPSRAVRLAYVQIAGAGGADRKSGSSRSGRAPAPVGISQRRADVRSEGAARAGPHHYRGARPARRHRVSDNARRKNESSAGSEPRSARRLDGRNGADNLDPRKRQSSDSIHRPRDDRRAGAYSARAGSDIQHCVSSLPERRARRRRSRARQRRQECGRRRDGLPLSPARARRAWDRATQLQREADGRAPQLRDVLRPRHDDDLADDAAGLDRCDARVRDRERAEKARPGRRCQSRGGAGRAGDP